MRKYLQFVALVAALLLCACSSGVGARQGAVVDTTHWETHCVGRFLISLPADAGKKFSAKLWKQNIIWRQDLTPETALLEAQKKIDSFKRIPHEKVEGSQFINSFPLAGGGIAVHRWDLPYNSTISIMDCYFISQDSHKRVFFYPYEVGVSHFASGRKRMEQMATTFYARDSWDPIPTEPGFAFEGGFSKHTGEWRGERAIVAFNLRSHPGIGGYFACYGLGKKQEFMFEQEGFLERLATVASKITVLRKGDCSLNGIPAQELCAAATENGRRKYTFDLEAPSTGADIDRPMLVLSIMSDNESSGNGFSSDAEALAIWDAIRNSIRLRPTGP